MKEWGLEGIKVPIEMAPDSVRCWLGETCSAAGPAWKSWMLKHERKWTEPLDHLNPYPVHADEVMLQFQALLMALVEMP